MKWIILIVSILLAFYVYIKSVIDSITLKFKLNELNDINFEGLTNRGNRFVKVRIKIIIKFFSLFNINIKDFNVSIYYNNDLIAKSTDNIIENTKQLNLIKNVDNIIYHTVDLRVNAKLIELAYKIRNNIAYTLDYNISLKVFGIPYKTSDSYNSINQ